MRNATLGRLTQLAAEKSSDNRRLLLRELSDLFLEQASGDSALAAEEFGRTADVLLDQLSAEVRSEFAQRFADNTTAPADLIARLANDVIEVARPVLINNPQLDEAALVGVAGERSQDHLRAISARREVSEAVSDAVIDRGDVETLAALTSNSGVQVSRTGFERLVTVSEREQSLRGAIVRRDDAPPDLLNDMMMFVEERLRSEILKRFARLDPHELDAALHAARSRVTQRGPTGPEIRKAKKAVRALVDKRRLNPGSIVDFLRGGDETAFLVALGEFVGLDHETMGRIWRNPEPDCMAMAVRAAGGERAFFVTLALEKTGHQGGDREMARAFGESFEAIDVSAAKRVMRFWKVRHEVDLQHPEAA